MPAFLTSKCPLARLPAIVGAPRTINGDVLKEAKVSHMANETFHKFYDLPKIQPLTSKAWTVAVNMNYTRASSAHLAKGRISSRTQVTYSFMRALNDTNQIFPEAQPRIRAENLQVCGVEEFLQISGLPTGASRVRERLVRMVDRINSYSTSQLSVQERFCLMTPDEVIDLLSTIAKDVSVRKSRLVPALET